MNTKIEQNILELKKVLIDRQKFSSFISNIRLLVFIAGVVFGLLVYGKIAEVVYYLALILFFAGFVYFVLLHATLHKQIEKIKSKIFVNEKYVARNNSTWENLKDKGEDFIDLDHSYSSDLDVFGEKSLFQFICAAYTHLGRNMLHKLLIAPTKKIESIKARQLSVEELGNDISFCIDFEAESFSNKTDTPPNPLFEYMKSPNNKLFGNKFFQIICYALPFISLVSLIFLVFRREQDFIFVIFLISVGLQGFTRLVLQPALGEILSQVGAAKKNVEAYESLITLIEKKQFTSSNLIAAQKRLFANGKKASKCIGQLKSIENAIDLKYNFLIYFIANLMLLWDFHVVFALDDWKKNYGPHVEDFVTVIGEFECLISLATLKQIETNTIFPEFTTEPAVFKATDMGHTLIPISKLVTNSISIQEKICIVTGSNMSGKTTLLRTVGINLVLAYAGAPVFAKDMKCSLMEIFTSMRLFDNISAGVSTFYAELIRIKKIIDFQKEMKFTEMQMIFLIDEIFRGTNSNDRILGAKSVIENLSNANTLGFVSTHDLELSEIKNLEKFYFTEYYKNDEIHFDYKLHKGISNTTNAKFLMKLVGINITDSE